MSGRFPAHIVHSALHLASQPPDGRCKRPPPPAPSLNGVSCPVLVNTPVFVWLLLITIAPRQTRHNKLGHTAMPTVSRPSPAEGRPSPAGQGPEDFEWTEECMPGDDGMPGHAGCGCAAGSCERGTCPCASSCLAPLGQGRLIALPPKEPAELELTACGPACACFGTCACSFDSAGAAALEAVGLREQAGKGWCAFAHEPLPAGLLICQYAGEYISNAEAQRRLAEYDAAGSGHALLVLREWLPSGTAAMRLNVDATKRGNLARFFNHSCGGGNLKLLLGRRAGPCPILPGRGGLQHA
ncbi:hypothetical protein ABPG77_006594 [Micractinium sp. CCAP 211/92]